MIVGKIHSTTFQIGSWVTNTLISKTNWKSWVPHFPHPCNTIAMWKNAVKPQGALCAGCHQLATATRVKVHLWKIISFPSLLYGMENLELRAKDLRELEKLQSSIVKRTIGFPLRCHHTHLLNAVNIQKPNFYIQNSLLSLWNRIFFSTFTHSPPEWEIVVHVFVAESSNTGYHYSPHEKYRRFPCKGSI